MLLWCAFLVIPGLLMYRSFAHEQRQNVQRANEAHARRMTAGAGPLEAQLERTPPPGHEDDVAKVVQIGAYIDRISEASILSSSWTVDFFVWFNWEGDIDPGESFKVVNGEILSRTLSKKSNVGAKRYALYRTSARITKAFDISRFPRDSHLLTLNIEDQALQAHEMVYVTDPKTTDISSRVGVEGYRIGSVSANVGTHSYKSSLGDPALPVAHRATCSQFTVGVGLERPDWGLFYKMVLALYVSVALALGGLWLASPSERLALAGTGLFVSIMNAECNAALLPATGRATLADMISDVGYIAIGMVILQGIIHHRFLHEFPGREHVARVFDTLSIVLITGLYVIINYGALSAAS
jgi:hypothetical protein